MCLFVSVVQEELSDESLSEEARDSVLICELYNELICERCFRRS